MACVALAGQRQIVGRCQSQVVWHSNAEAQFALHADRRHQEAAFALDRGVGDLKSRKLADRDAENLECRVFETHSLGPIVPDDPFGLEPPDRGSVGIFLAWFAGRVDAIVERRENAAAPLGAFGREIRLVHGFDAQRIDESVSKIVGDVDSVRIDLGAFGVDDLDLAAGNQSASLAVVCDALGNQSVAAIFDLYAACRRHRLVIVVVDQSIGFQQHLAAGWHRRSQILYCLRERSARKHDAGKKACHRRRAVEAR